MMLANNSHFQNVASHKNLQKQSGNNHLTHSMKLGFLFKETFFKGCFSFIVRFFIKLPNRLQNV